MTIELQMLAWSVLLGLAQVALSASLSTAQRGLAYNIGPRDEVRPPLVGVAGRVDRALRNFSETFPLFAAAALSVSLAQRGDAHSALGAQLYFWARVAYVPVYAAGISYLRTLVWAVATIGIVMVLLPLF